MEQRLDLATQHVVASTRVVQERSAIVTRAVQRLLNTPLT
jgi:hypothetical protein